MSPSSLIFRKLNHDQRRKAQMKIFQTTMVIISGQFTVFQYKFGLSQVKLEMISSILESVNELTHKFTNGLKVRTQGNQEKLENSKSWGLSLMTQTQPKKGKKTDIKVFSYCLILGVYYRATWTTF